MPVVTLDCLSGARRVRRTATFDIGDTVLSISLQTPDGSSRYPSVAVLLDQFLTRLANLDQQEVRIPPTEGENDLTMASSDGDVWLWIRPIAREDGGADVVIDQRTLRDALTVGNVAEAVVAPDGGA